MEDEVKLSPRNQMVLITLFGDYMPCPIKRGNVFYVDLIHRTNIALDNLNYAFGLTESSALRNAIMKRINQNPPKNK